MRKYLLVALVFSLALAVNADFVQGLRQVNNVLMQVVPPEEQAKTEQQQPQAETVKKPKYIFYFIGVGAVEFGGFKENTNNAISMAKLVDPEAEFPRKPYKKAILQY
jgi:hypothetical protein